MKKRRESRQRWIEARTAVAEELLRAHASEPNPSLADIRSSIHADDRLFGAALNHLVATGRLPRDVLPKGSRVVADETRERLLTHLASYGGCTTDVDALRSILDIADPQRVKSVIDLLVERHCIIVTSDRIFLPPDDACLNAVVDEVPTPRFSISDIAGTVALASYAGRSGVARTTIENRQRRRRRVS
jgi:hypothetical protein